MRHPRIDVHWHELADLPFAAALAPHPGPLAPGAAYDGAHFDRLDVEDAELSGGRFLECAFTHVSVQGCRLRRAKLTDVWMRDVRLTATSLAESTWMDAVVIGSAIAGVEAFGAQLRRVTLRGCKLDSVNFRGAALTEVSFDNCLLRDVDFASATLTRVAFPDSRLTGTDFSRVTMDAVDLRGAELGITIDSGSLRGATVTPGQLADMAGLLAEMLGIAVEDRPAPA